MRPTQEELRRIPNVRTSNILRLSKLKSDDSRNHERVVGLDDRRPEDWVGCARALHQVDPFDHVVAYHELDQDKAALIAESLGLPFHSVATIQAIRNKQKMREVLERHGVNSVPCGTVTNLEDIRVFAGKHGYPVIVKPCEGWASANIILVDDSNDLQSKSKDIENALHQNLIVECFVQGEEYSLEAISEDGQHYLLGVTAKIKDPKTFVEIGHTFPAPLSDERRLELENYLCDVLNALGVTYGPTHTEVIVSDRHCVVIETHTRSGGDLIPSLVQDACGVNTFELVAHQSVGESIKGLLENLPNPHCSASILYFTPQTQGVIRHIEGVEDARQCEGIVEVGVQKVEGDTIVAVRDSFDRAFYIRAVGATAEESLRRCTDAATKIRYVTESVIV
jgi:biotin carboxylase